MKYQYEITNVDAQARCMQISYTADGLTPFTVSARLPYQGEDLENIIHSYAPISFWEHQTKVDVVPQTGSGEIDTEVLAAKMAAARAAEIAARQANKTQPLSVGAQTL